MEEFTKILSVTRIGIIESLKYFDQRDRLLTLSNELLEGLDKERPIRKRQWHTSSKAVLLARIQKAFGPVMPELREVRKTSPALYDEIQDYNADEIYGILHPSSRDLLPFAMQLSLLSGLNSRPLWNLEYGRGVRTAHAFGCERVVFINQASYRHTDTAGRVGCASNTVGGPTSSDRSNAKPEARRRLAAGYHRCFSSNA